MNRQEEQVQVMMRALIERLVELLRSAQAGDPAALAAAAGLRGELRGEDQVPEEVRLRLERALSAVEQLQEGQIIHAFDCLTGWLERKDALSGAQVDDLVRMLEGALGPLLSPGGAAQEAATEERLRQAARSSIAERLRQAGFRQR